MSQPADTINDKQFPCTVIKTGIFYELFTYYNGSSVLTGFLKVQHDIFMCVLFCRLIILWQLNFANRKDRYFVIPVELIIQNDTIINNCSFPRSDLRVPVVLILHFLVSTEVKLKSTVLCLRAEKKSSPP